MVDFTTFGLRFGHLFESHSHHFALLLSFPFCRVVCRSIGGQTRFGERAFGRMGEFRAYRKVRPGA